MISIFRAGILRAELADYKVSLRSNILRLYLIGIQYLVHPHHQRKSIIYSQRASHLQYTLRAFDNTPRYPIFKSSFTLKDQAPLHKEERKDHRLPKL